MERTPGLAVLALTLVLLVAARASTPDNGHAVAHSGGRPDKLPRRLELEQSNGEEYTVGSGTSLKSAAPSSDAETQGLSSSSSSLRVFSQGAPPSKSKLTQGQDATPDMDRRNTQAPRLKLPFFSSTKNSLYNSSNNVVTPLRQYAPRFPNYPYVPDFYPNSQYNRPASYDSTPVYGGSKYDNVPPGFASTPTGYPYFQYAAGYSEYPPPSSSPYDPYGFTSFPPKPPSAGYSQYGPGHSNYPSSQPGAAYPQYGQDFSKYRPTPTGNPYSQYGQDFPTYPFRPSAGPYPQYDPGYSVYPTSQLNIPQGYYPPGYPGYRPSPAYPPYDSGYESYSPRPPFTQGYPGYPPGPASPWSNPWSSYGAPSAYPPPGLPAYMPPWYRPPDAPPRPIRRKPKPPKDDRNTDPHAFWAATAGYDPSGGYATQVQPGDGLEGYGTHPPKPALQWPGGYGVPPPPNSGYPPHHHNGDKEGPHDEDDDDKRDRVHEVIKEELKDKDDGFGSEEEQQSKFTTTLTDTPAPDAQHKVMTHFLKHKVDQRGLRT